MNNRKPQILVIASVLKPVDDVRMYKKFGKSLARTGKYAVNIVGFQTQATLDDAAIRFHPLFGFSRLHWKRLVANYFFYQALKRIAPHILILTTPELYPAAWWYRKQFGGSLVYDIVENYGRNIRHNRGFSSLLIVPLAQVIASVERRLLNAATTLLVAEQGYVSELDLPASQVYVVENKAMAPQPAASPRVVFNTPLSIVYTGTISEVYGIGQALAVVKSIVEDQGLSATFTVRGHVPQQALHRRLREYARQHSWLVLQTEDHPVPHDDILALIRQADFGVVSHQPVPSIAHCFPTRIWEYMAYRLPFLLQDHTYWTRFCQPWKCAISLDFNRPDVDRIKKQMMENEFYPRGLPDTIYWSTEEKKLLRALDKVTTRR